MSYLCQQGEDNVVSVEHTVGGTPPTLMCYTEVHVEVDRSRHVCENIRYLVVSTPLTSVVGHLLCLYLGGVWKRSAIALRPNCDPS